MKDILAIIEAAYAESPDPESWLQGALEAIAPHLDQGNGVLANRFAHTAGGFWRGDISAVGPDRDFLPDLDRIWQEHLASASPEDSQRLIQTVYPRAPVVTWVNRLLGHVWTRDVVKDPASLPREVKNRLSASPDSLGVIAGDPSGHGAIFFARGSGARLPRQTEALWLSVASHLVTGYRLARRKRLGPDAILRPDGKALHFECDGARRDAEPLSEATRAIDRARGKLRRTDPERALALWRGLVSGQWSLVDHFDHDGRRYVFARRNAPEVRPWHSLTERESQVLAFVAQGQTHKIIAYQLGLSPSAVGESLLRARRKLGARSRLDLVAAYLASQERPDP